MSQDAVKDKFRYLVVGSLDDPEALPPKGEFFCSNRASWMPEVPSKSDQDLWIFITDHCRCVSQEADQGIRVQYCHDWHNAWVVYFVYKQD